MSSEKTKWWKTPPYSNIVGGLSVLAIAGVLRLAYEWITAPTALTTIKNFWDLIASSFSFVLNYQFKLWWLIFVGIFIWYYRYFTHLLSEKNKLFKEIHSDISHIKGTVTSKNQTLALKKINNNTNKILKVKVLNYKADKFDKIVWVWDWIFNDLIKEYEIKNLSPVCPNVDCKNNTLAFSWEIDSVRGFLCLKCEKTTRVVSTNEQVENKIMSNIESFY